MMDLINYKDTTDDLECQIKEFFKELDYRQIELAGANTMELSRFDKTQEILCKDIVYNYIKTKIEETKLRKRFVETYGIDFSEAEKWYKEWADNAITKKED